MKVFVAAASGAIGRPLIAGLLREVHVVTGITRSEAGARLFAELGAEVARVSAFDGDAVEQPLRQSRAGIIID
jgi:nucleoside-diphosphate-sugar epimerase